MSTILFIDDNPHAQRMGREVLGDEGHQVVVFAGGEDAVKYLSSHRPDLVFADAALPGRSGFEICGMIRSDPRLADVKVVLLRPPLVEFDAQRAEQVRSDGVLKKPLDASMLLRTVQSLLEDAPAGRAPQVAQDFPQEPNGAFSPLGPGVDEAPDVSRQLETAVEQALTEDSGAVDLREEVRVVVTEVFEAVTPALIDRITERVLHVLGRK